jgi:hypothetical protein
MLHKTLRGADLHSPSSELIENNTGTTIPVLKAVKFNGMGALYPQVTLANSTTDIIRGITQADIPTGTPSFITSLGFLNGVDTSAWPTNTTLYADNFGNITNAPNNLPVATVLAQDATNGIIYVNSTGITAGELDALTFPDSLSLELAWDILHPSFYSEPMYDMSGKIIQYNIWDTAAKGLHIFNKTYTYTGTNITKVVITRVYDSKTLEKDLTYSGSQVITVTRTYTP